MAVRVIREAGLNRQAWKNGGGVTAEIAVHPAGAGLETFDWRLSMADVASDGPFSSFPGVDRTLVLIRGEALLLDAGGSVYRVDASAPILAFEGEGPAIDRLPAGPVRDFNVMTRRGRFAHNVSRVSRGMLTVEGEALLLAHADPLTVIGAGEIHHLAPFDSLLIEGGAHLDLDGPALLTRLEPVSPPPAPPPA